MIKGGGKIKYDERGSVYAEAHHTPRIAVNCGICHKYDKRGNTQTRADSVTDTVCYLFTL